MSRSRSLPTTVILALPLIACEIQPIPMDNRHLPAGTTVYLLVQVEGALFSIGDTHAVQGDGEVSDTAIETPMRIVLTLEVVANTRGIVEPQYETGDYYAVTGFATPIDHAARKATRYMIDYLLAEHGLIKRPEPYMLCSLTGDLKISETVHVPHMLVSMHMPKGIFSEWGTFYHVASQPSSTPQEYPTA